jgi:hypothetical protein
MFVEMKNRSREIKTLVADALYGGDANVQLAANGGVQRKRADILLSRQKNIRQRISGLGRRSEYR